MCGERSLLLGHPGRQFPQDFALPSPLLRAGPVKLGGEGESGDECLSPDKISYHFLTTE